MDYWYLIGKVVNEVQVHGNIIVFNFADGSCLEIQTDDEPMKVEFVEG